MNRFISAVCALFMVQQAVIALPAAAQSTESSLSQQTNTQTFNTTTTSALAVQNAPDTPGPTVAALRAGVALNTSQERVLNSSVANPHAGESVALMVVGGAGLVTGLLIGGNGGAAIAIGGAVIGLYGLYEYVR